MEDGPSVVVELVGATGLPTQFYVDRLGGQSTKSGHPDGIATITTKKN
jgi:hypothetical protein